MGDTLPNLSAGMDMFKKALLDYEATVDAATRDDITQEQFDAFCSLAWNCESAMYGSTLIKRFNARAPTTVVVYELQRWNRAGGMIDPGLVERRQCESDLLLYGVYRTQGQKLVKPENVQ